MKTCCTFLFPALLGLASSPVLAHGDHSRHDHNGHHEHHEHPQQDGESGHRQHGAHVHGEGVVTLVQEGEALVVELKTPAYNLLGFEHAPRSDEQRDLLDRTRVALDELEALITFPRHCTRVSGTVTVPGWAESVADGDHGEEHDRDHHHHHDHEHDSHQGHHDHQHEDFVTRHEFACRDTLTMDSVGFPLFESYPAFERVQVQWLLDSGQGAAVVTPARPRVR